MQAIFPTSNSQPALYGLGITDVSFGSQTFASSSSLTDLQGGDASSPEAFRHNIHLVHQQVARIQGLASSALAEIQHAYQPGKAPTTAYMTALKQALQQLTELLRQSGVGALPVLGAADPLPTEEKLMADLSTSIEHEYGKYKHMQENSAVVFNLLSTAEQVLRR